ncbi:GtrA family protein [Pararhizobium sp. YC-54]|uniref:GtrA family protein n=1 Tax=Pararhizobium sp. YC-54 TaxID=2986920 RepID=UPI0021F6AE78|nr:GtrA family protein [Pararhizobium sp. YC-54]MCW0002194.1 GtrA family protein [Pararhizobium sp. YC-54]
MFTRSSRTLEAVRFLRFAAVGLLNTTLGYTIILAALASGCGDIVSNILGYAFGLLLGFVLNSRWTFADAARLRKGTLLRYALSFVIAYGANLAVVFTALSCGLANNPWVHLAGICVYSVLFYLASSRFVFGPAPLRNHSDDTVS